MTSLYGTDGLRILIRDREQRLFREAEQERAARRVRRQAKASRPAPSPLRDEVEWGPWLQAGEPLQFSGAGAGLS